MRKWIAKAMLFAVIAVPLGAGARVMADDVIANPNAKVKEFKHDNTGGCGCLYHVIEKFVIGIFD